VDWPGSIWLVAVAFYLLLLPIIIFGGKIWQRSLKDEEKN